MGIAMSMNSINTPYGSFVALQNLAETMSQMRQVQDRISTGRAVNSSRDSGAIWGMAQNLRASSLSINAVTGALDRAQSIADVALSAGSAISDLLSQMKEAALAASDTGLDTASRSALNDQFKTLRDTLKRTVDTAEFNGINMIKASGATLTALASVTGGSYVTVAAQNLSLGGANVTVTANASFATAADASTYLSRLTTSINNVNQRVGTMGAQSKALELHNSFMAKLRDALDVGVSNLVDANLGQESARLQSLKARQQLGLEAVAIANQSSTLLVGLFRPTQSSS
jgi:flagellin